MNNLWLKIRIWSKSILFGAIVLYLLLFFFNNSAEVRIWYWFGRYYTGATWYMLLGVFLMGAVVALLTRTAFKTVRQMRQLKQRTQQDRMQKELTDMKAKAAMLQTRTTSTQSVTTQSSPMEPRTGTMGDVENL